MSNKSNIYTKTGDKGETSLYNGERVPKDGIFCKVVGALDELSSSIGIFYTELELKVTDKSSLDYINLVNIFKWIQSRLLDLGSHVATPIDSTRSNKTKLSQTDFEEENVSELEKLIDEYDMKLPKLTNFILPYGALHMSRTICRRAERKMIALFREGHVNKFALIFLNRLSDLLFVLARYVCHFVYATPEHVYKKGKTIL
jgi:cob(I)alamin adenosyltransferase